MNEPVDVMFVPPTIRDILAAPTQITIKPDSSLGAEVRDTQLRAAKILSWVARLAYEGVSGGIIHLFLAEMDEACHLYDAMKSEIGDLSIRSKSLQAQVDKLSERT